MPDVVEVQFIKSAFDGLLPRHFEKSVSRDASGQGLWKREQTRIAPPGLNDLNREDPSVYVSGAVACVDGGRADLQDRWMYQPATTSLTSTFRPTPR